MRADLDADPRCSHCGGEYSAAHPDEETCRADAARERDRHDDAGDARVLAWLGLDEGAL